MYFKGKNKAIGWQEHPEGTKPHLGDTYNNMPIVKLYDVAKKIEMLDDEVNLNWNDVNNHSHNVSATFNAIENYLAPPLAKIEALQIEIAELKRDALGQGDATWLKDGSIFFTNSQDQYKFARFTQQIKDIENNYSMIGSRYHSQLPSEQARTEMMGLKHKENLQTHKAASLIGISKKEISRPLGHQELPPNYEPPQMKKAIRASK